jgi:lysophospholipase L1-like esterase
MRISLQKKTILIFLLLSMTILLISKENDMSGDAIKLYVIGDSTASAYGADTYPRAGWAQVFHDFFNKEKVIIENRARSGRSSKSFYNEGLWKPVYSALKKGDYVFIQFGHNDSKKEDQNRYTEPFTDYKKYLKIYADNAREKHAVPVLLTPVHRNSWTNDGKIKDTHGDYPKAMRELAAELDAPLIDIHKKSRDLFESMGERKMDDIFLVLKKGKYKNYPNGVSDNTHFQENGAKKICALVIEGIKELNLEIAGYLK